MPIVHIPIPFELPQPPDSAAIDATLQQYGVTRGRYLFNPNGIQDFKGYPLLLETTQKLRTQSSFEDVVLVTAGRKRDWQPRDDVAERNGELLYLGTIPHGDVIKLAGGALITAVVGTESLSRSALECIAAGGNVIVPSLPEFLDSIPAHVMAADGAEALSKQIIDLTQRKAFPNYPLSSHEIESVVEQYRMLERPPVSRGSA
ncbi:MAG: glycosyltransferase family 4 protein [Rhodospirillales bacterium]|nr:glycosyltransferase family 4 protein [Rhodospirillales bacterium]